jgi:hypothetical protein
MGKNWKTYKKLHKWPGLIISFVLLYYGVTGIIMNHRELFSGIDLNRSVMPSNYKYNKWNNAALKGSLIIGRDSVLVYGNIGIWLTDSTFSNFASFNEGLPGGSDNRKIFDIHKTGDGNIYAAAFSGLFGYDRKSHRWNRFNINDREKRFTGIESIGDTVYAINRSHLYTGKSEGINSVFTRTELSAPPGYDKKVTLFQTIWQIHSGEILGIPGKVYVDILGIITIFLSATGIIWFFFPDWIRRRVRQNKNAAAFKRTGKWSLKWHNITGAWTFPFLILLFLTGMFLRPPLLIAIGQARVLPVKYTNLDQPNPWYDKLRDILYDPGRGKLFLATSEGIYMMDPIRMEPEAPLCQPPVSVMGITVFQQYLNGSFLVGSFSGLFKWYPEKNEVIDFITGEPYRETGMGRPVGDYKVTGMITDIKGSRYLVDYSSGIAPIHHQGSFPAMPEKIIRESKISLWNISLEIHTGRIFENITGGLYILIVPLVGITGIIIVFSGYILWRRKFKKQGYENIY